MAEVRALGFDTGSEPGSNTNSHHIIRMVQLHLMSFGQHALVRVRTRFGCRDAKIRERRKTDHDRQIKSESMGDPRSSKSVVLVFCLGADSIISIAVAE